MYSEGDMQSPGQLSTVLALSAPHDGSECVVDRLRKVSNSGNDLHRRGFHNSACLQLIEAQHKHESSKTTGTRVDTYT